jgi:hypothetical protein
MTVPFDPFDPELVRDPRTPAMQPSGKKSPSSASRSGCGAVSAWRCQSFARWLGGEC